MIACDKFKGTLTQQQVIEHLIAGLRDVAGSTLADPAALPVRSVLVADGGDGTLQAALAAGFAHRPVRCTGPTGEPVNSGYAYRGEVAVVELADACGLVRMPGGRLDALRASSRGLGEVIRAALTDGRRRIILGLGGSASTDGGAGMLAALGARFLDADGVDLPDGGGFLAELARVDLSGLPVVVGEAGSGQVEVAEVEFIVACDVDNPLLGEQGAAAVFGPQKGASQHDVRVLEAGLARLAELVEAAVNPAGSSSGSSLREAPGAGAAGGVGWAAMQVLGATMRPGIDLILELSGFTQLLAGASLVITGEGSLDTQTLRGKAPAGVSAAARAAGVPVVAVCGVCQLDDAELATLGVARRYALTDLQPDLDVCRRDAGPLLRQLARRVADDWLSATGYHERTDHGSPPAAG